MKLPVEKVATISTGHLRDKDLSSLNYISTVQDRNQPFPFRVAKHTHGFIVFLVLQPEWRARGYVQFSRQFQRIYRAAVQQEFTLLNFDADGTVLPTRPTGARKEQYAGRE